MYSDIDDEMKKNVLSEFAKLAKDNGFASPEIKFLAYTYDKNRKLKRVERLT